LRYPAAILRHRLRLRYPRHGVAAARYGANLRDPVIASPLTTLA
jgi:hypothetical protein